MAVPVLYAAITHMIVADLNESLKLGREINLESLTMGDRITLYTMMMRVENARRTLLGAVVMDAQAEPIQQPTEGA